MHFFSRRKTYTYGVPTVRRTKSALKCFQTSLHAQQTYVVRTEEVTGEEASSEGQGWRTKAAQGNDGVSYSLS